MGTVAGILGFPHRLCMPEPPGTALCLPCSAEGAWVGAEPCLGCPCLARALPQAVYSTEGRRSQSLFGGSTSGSLSAPLQCSELQRGPTWALPTWAGRRDAGQGHLGAVWVQSGWVMWGTGVGQAPHGTSLGQCPYPSLTPAAAGLMSPPPGMSSCTVPFALTDPLRAGDLLQDLLFPSQNAPSPSPEGPCATTAG